MKTHASPGKATEHSSGGQSTQSSAGHSAIAIAAPGYGVEFVDRGLRANGPGRLPGLGVPEDTSAAAAAPRHAVPAAVVSDLRIGEPDDSYEREAERAANDVMSGDAVKRHWSLSSLGQGTPLQRKCGCGGSGDAEGECEHCKEENQGRTLQRKAAGGVGRGGAPPIVHDVLRSSGQPLDRATRDFFEPRFGRDLSQIRVHADEKASASARSVDAHAYAVNQHIVFSVGQYEPSAQGGRRLLAHELAHTIQQGGGAAARPGFSSLARAGGTALQRNGNKYAKLTIAELRQLLLTDPEAAEALRLRYRAMSPSELRRYAVSDAIAQSEYERMTIVPKEAEGTGPFSKREVREVLEQELERQRAASGIPRRTSSAVTPGIRTEGGTMGTATTDVPGLDRVFTGRSPQAGGAVNAASKFPPATDPAVLPQTHGHAEQDLADQLEKALRKIPREQLQGKRVWMLIEQEPCSTCAQGAGDAAQAAGVLRRLSQEFPELVFEIKNLTSNSIIVLQGGKGVSAASAAAAQNAPAGKGAAPASAQVSTTIEVTNSVKQANGTTVSEVEYTFGENLKQINKGAPPGAELPSRIVVRVTQNAEGVITSVEALSGQPQALAEALVQRTLTPALAGEAAGAAEGAAASAAGRTAMLAKGLKIGGWAAFAVITGYQLYKATPAERPKVAAEAAGGLAAGIGTTYLVCNALLGIETFGWSLVICGFVAGGVGGYAGSKATGAIYDELDEATATDLDRAFRTLSTKSANERVVFNILVNKMGYTANCIDAGFVSDFMSTIPAHLQESEAVLLAAQFANASIVPPAAPTPRAPSPSFGTKSTVCPSCHGRTQSSVQPTLPPFDQATFDAIKAAPTCSSIRSKALSALATAVKTLPRYRRAPGDIAHHPDPGIPAPTLRAIADPKAFSSVAEQTGKGTCPGDGCHAPNMASKPLLGPISKPSAADERAMLDWMQSQKKPAVTGNAHPMTPVRKDDPFKGLGGMGSGPGGEMTDADRQKLLDFITSGRR